MIHKDPSVLVILEWLAFEFRPSFGIPKLNTVSNEILFNYMSIVFWVRYILYQNMQLSLLQWSAILIYRRLSLRLDISRTRDLWQVFMNWHDETSSEKKKVQTIDWLKDDAKVSIAPWSWTSDLSSFAIHDESYSCSWNRIWQLPSILQLAWIPLSQEILHSTISYSGLCKYHFSLHSRLYFLHKSQYIVFATLSCLLRYNFSVDVGDALAVSDFSSLSLYMWYTS